MFIHHLDVILLSTCTGGSALITSGKVAQWHYNDMLTTEVIFRIYLFAAKWRI